MPFIIIKSTLVCKFSDMRAFINCKHTAHSCLCVGQLQGIKEIV